MQFSLDFILIVILTFYDFVYFLAGLFVAKQGTKWQRNIFFGFSGLVLLSIIASLVTSFALRGAVITMLLVLGGFSLLYTLYTTFMNIIIVDEAKRRIDILERRMDSFEDTYGDKFDTDVQSADVAVEQPVDMAASASAEAADKPADEQSAVLGSNPVTKQTLGWSNDVTQTRASSAADGIDDMFATPGIAAVAQAH
jgi:hypothetical protein